MCANGSVWVALHIDVRDRRILLECVEILDTRRRSFLCDSGKVSAEACGCGLASNWVGTRASPTVNELPLMHGVTRILFGRKLSAVAPGTFDASNRTVSMFRISVPLSKCSQGEI